MKAWFERMGAYIEHGMWQEDLEHSGWFKRHGLRQLQIVVLAVQEIKREKLLLRAHALTYTSLLSLIPLLALMAVAFRGLGGMSMLDRQLKPWLLKTFVPQTGQQVYSYINGMLDNVSFQSLGVIGLLGFLYTAISALQRIEQSFNEVMHTTNSRRFVLRMAMYWSIITLGPLLLGVSLSLQAQIGQLVAKQSVMQSVSSHWIVGSFFSVLLTCLAFWLLYQFIPAREIHIPSALYGAVSMGLTWELLKRTYYLSLSSSFKLNKVYGTLAILPMTLIWLYITWLLVLLGAVLTYVHQHHHQFAQSRRQRELSMRAMEQLCLHLMLLIARRFHLGQEPASTEDLLSDTGVGAVAIEDALKRLEEGRYVAQVVEVQGKSAQLYVPGRDLQSLSVLELLQTIRRQGEPALLQHLHPGLRQLLADSEAARDAQLAGLSLFDLLQREMDLEATEATAPTEATVPTEEADDDEDIDMESPQILGGR